MGLFVFLLRLKYYIVSAFFLFCCVIFGIMYLRSLIRFSS